MKRSKKTTSTLWRDPAAPPPSQAEAPPRSGGPGGWVAGPPRLVGGANRQGDHVSPSRPDESVCIDWLTYTGPSEHVDRIKDFLCDECGLGDPDPDNNKGIRGYSRAYRWGSIVLAHRPEDRGAGRFKLDIPGSGCTALRETVRLSDLCRFLHYAGSKPTRVDIAVDFYSREDGADVQLVQDVVGGCQRGELVRTRTVVLYGSSKNLGGELVADGASIRLGKRGRDGSGRSVICYDKGLETGTLEANRWHRWEAGFAHDCAVQLMEALQSDLGETHLRAVALGAVDFLADPGKRRRDRPRAQWWADIIDGQDVRTIKPRRVPNALQGVRKWVDQGVSSALKTYALASQLSITELVQDLIGQDPKPSKNVAGSQAFREWCRHLGIPYHVGLRRAGFAEWTKHGSSELKAWFQLRKLITGQDPPELPEALNLKAWQRAGRSPGLA